MALLTNISQPVLALTSATIDYTTNTGTNNTRIGYTYERQGDEDDASDEHRKRVDQTISSSLSLQARHVIGFGSGNIWLDPRNRDPNSNAWNWKGLDARIARMRASAGPGKAELVLTAGMAPNWMTTIEGQKDRSGNYYPNNRPITHYSQYPDINGNGIAGEKYEDNPVAPAHQDEIWDDEQHQAPDPWYEDDFAYMIKQIALRYPDVKVWQVWNEFKGLYRADLNRWDYERYTRLYNKVYTAIKEANPSAKVGGPYLSLSIWTNSNPGSTPTARAECRGDWGIMTGSEIGHHVSDTNTSVLGYWLKHKVGADFITFSWATKSWKVPNYPFDPFQVSKRINGVMECIRSTKDDTGAVFADAKNLPVAAAEFYPNVPSASTTENGANDPASEAERAAIMANASGEMIKSKYNHFLFWDMMTSHDGGSRSCDPTNTAGTLSLLINPARWKCTEYPKLRANESKIAPILRLIKTVFAASRSTGHPVTFDATKVGVFASNLGTMIVNKQNHAEELAINACLPIRLSPFEVRFLPKMDCTSSGNTGGGSTGGATGPGGGSSGTPGTGQPSNPGGGSTGGQPSDGRGKVPITGGPICILPFPSMPGAEKQPKPSDPASDSSGTDTSNDTTTSHPSDSRYKPSISICTGPLSVTPDSLPILLPMWFALFIYAYIIISLLLLVYIALVRLIRYLRK